MTAFERLTEKHLVEVAKLEIAAWYKLPVGLVTVILFAFVHRVTTGRPIEDFFKSDAVIDYEI